MPRHAGRHAEDDDGDQQRRGEPEQGGHVRLDLEDADGAQQDDDRDRGQQGRQQHAPDRVVDLRPYLRFHLAILPDGPAAPAGFFPVIDL